MLGDGQTLNKSCISKLILPGTLISLRTENNPTWSLNIVFHCCDEGIDIPLTSSLMKSCLFIGTCLAIKFKNSYFEYIIQGSISRIELCGSPYIRVQVFNIFENKNHRLFPRQDVYLPATLSIDNNNTYYCTVSNISLGGAALLLNKRIPNATECEANILLNDKNTIFGKGIILRCSPLNSLVEFSMKFTFMDEENSNCLYSYFHSLNNSYNSLRSQYLITS